jgi:hypothetical protein
MILNLCRRWLTRQSFKATRPRRPAARPHATPRGRGRPAFEVLEDRTCLSTLIDATAVLATIPSLSLDNGAVVFNAAHPVQTLDLAQGAHTLAQPSGGSVTFSVTDANGDVYYDPSLEGALTGSGSNSLSVFGRPITIDASALDATRDLLGLNNSAVIFPTNTTLATTVLPGLQTLSGNSGTPGGSVSFAVTNQGTIDLSGLDPLLDGVLAVQDGAGTQLQVIGRTITIDFASEFHDTEPFLNLNFSSHNGSFSTASSFAATVLPGTQTLSGNNGEPGFVTFTVTPQGKVDFGADLDGVLVGRNGTDLTVNGRPITIDARLLTQTSLVLSTFVQFNTASPFQGRLLPGNGYFLLGGSGTAGFVRFDLHNDGMFDISAYPSLANVLSVQGGTDLVVHGVTIAIDATAFQPSVSNLSLDERYFFNSNGPYRVTLLPGAGQLLQEPGTFGFVTFTVNDDGTIAIPRALALSDTLEVQIIMGVSKLIVRGETIHIDARALSGVSSTFTIAGIGTFDTSTVLTLTVLPGWEQFQAGNVTLDFQADLFNTVNYDPYLDELVASGLGTDTLTLLPPM